LETQHVDDRAREQEDENKGGDDCAARTEGDVTKDVEKRDFVGKLGQPIEHRVGSLLSAWRSLERGLLGESLLQRLDDRTHFGTEGPLHHHGVAGTNGLEYSRLQRRRHLGIAAPGTRGKSLPQSMHERSRAKNEVNA